MSGWGKKVFWKEVSVTETPEGFAIALDGRAIKTPAKASLALPTRDMAELIAAEWSAQQDEIRPESMPATRAANAAIDKVRVQFDEVAALIAAYGETDLLCYRAEGPEELVARQRAHWDPLLEWSAGRYGVQWSITQGIMPTDQSSETLERLAAEVSRFTPFQLTAFHDLVAMSGSLVIGLAVTEGVQAPEALWQVSRIDEDWQIEQWGEDEEATAQAAHKRAAFLDAARFFTLCGC